MTSTDIARPTYQLYLGDCLDFMRTLEAGSVDACITDPPYGIGTWSSTGGNSISAAQANDMNRWDILPDQSYFNEVFRVSKVVIVWGMQYVGSILGSSRAPLVWDKKIRGMHFADGEMAWTNFDWGTLRILEYPIASGDTKNHKQHPTQKPTGVIRWCIEQARIPLGATIFDPFMGSGTTGVACMQLGRNFIGCEIDPNYYAIAEKRIHEASLQPPLFTDSEDAPKIEQAALL